MINNSKIVTAPLHINDMDDNLESQTTYIFNYEKSSLKNDDFLNYIENCGVISDVYISTNVNTDEKILLLLSYMNSKRFYHLMSFNATILNIIYQRNNIHKFIKYGFLNSSEITYFLKKYSTIIDDWISVYNSLFIYMLNMLQLSKENITNIFEIKKKYNELNFNNRKDLSVNIFSLLQDPFFYDYYTIKENKYNNYYYTYYFDNLLYDEKSVPLLLLNKDNFILKILYDSLYNENFKKYLLKQI